MLSKSYWEPYCCLSRRANIRRGAYLREVRGCSGENDVLDERENVGVTIRIGCSREPARQAWLACSCWTQSALYVTIDDDAIRDCENIRKKSEQEIQYPKFESAGMLRRKHRYCDYAAMCTHIAIAHAVTKMLELGGSLLRELS
ncbi:hypothetical protein EIP86_009596 [Pleurotus ostreatoroseus]|nr:hypothetical protein EIP86_009596 [Pleurotus ostreatoroseus]